MKNALSFIWNHLGWIALVLMLGNWIATPIIGGTVWAETIYRLGMSAVIVQFIKLLVYEAE